MNYRDYAKDLRALADLFDATARDLPLPQYDLPLDISLHVAEQSDVDQAARAFGVRVSAHGRHPVAERHVDSVTLTFVWVSPAVMAEYDATFTAVSA